MSKAKQPRPTPIDLDVLIATFGAATNYWAEQQDAGLLARAKLADSCRDASLRPASPQAFDACWSSLDDNQANRFCLFVSAFRLPEVAKRLKSRQADDVLADLHELAVQLDLLTLEMLQQSDVRLEEYSRHFCAMWGLQIKGERTSKSEARLIEIDFARLMQEAENARSSAEERLAYLRELQENEEQTRRPRRGKW